MRYFYISIIILILGYFHIFSPVRNLAQYIFAPFQFGLREVAFHIKDTGKLFSNIDKMRQENIRLIKENLDLQSEVSRLKEVSTENEALRDQLGVKDSFDKELLMASIMKDANDMTGTRFILDKGLSHGVEEGDNVVYSNYIVGVVRQVDEYRSVAEFISSSDVSVAVYDIDSPGKTEGLATGQFGSSIKVNRILPTEEVKIGDIMMTSGKDGVFTPGLLVGKIKEIEQNPADTLKSAYLETDIELNRLQIVFILTD